MAIQTEGRLDSIFGLKTLKKNQKSFDRAATFLSTERKLGEMLHTDNTLSKAESQLDDIQQSQTGNRKVKNNILIQRGTSPDEIDSVSQSF